MYRAAPLSVSSLLTCALAELPERCAMKHPGTRPRSRSSALFIRLSATTQRLTLLLTDLLLFIIYYALLHDYTNYHCLGGAVVGRWTRDRKVAGSTPGQGAIKSTRSTQPSIPPG